MPFALLPLLYILVTTGPLFLDASLLLSPPRPLPLLVFTPLPTGLSAVTGVHALPLLTPANLGIDLGFDFTCLATFSDLMVWLGHPFLLLWQPLLLYYSSLCHFMLTNSFPGGWVDGWMDGWMGNLFIEKVASV